MAPSKPNRSPGDERQGRARLLFSRTIPSRTDEVEPLVEGIVAEIGHLVSLDGHREAIDLALREAVVNAVVHGNRLDPATKVQVECYELPGRQVMLVVRDEGPGFDPNQIEDPTKPENLERATGRGIFLIRQFMDEVDFGDGGREIRMKKKC